MLLHIMYDEKIVSRIISYFEEALPNGNQFIIIMGRNASPKYVKDNKPNVCRVRYGGSAFWKAVGDVNAYDYILLHNLGTPSIRFVSKINHPRIVWCVWGADLFGGYLARRGYQLQNEQFQFEGKTGRKKSIYNKLYEFVIKKLYEKKRVSILKKITYIATLDEEMELLKQYYSEANHIRKKELFYYPVDALISHGQINSAIGDDIIIGNSSTPNGNHKEVFMELSKLDLKGRRIITPLSYGNMLYKDYIIPIGESLFGSSFVPLTEFLPLDKYIDTMKGARTYIYGNYRQEGFGNIVMALCWGGAVFLHPSNILLSHFKRMGCTLFSTMELSEKLHYVLTEEEKNKNAQIVFNYYNKNHLLEIIQHNFGSNSY